MHHAEFNDPRLVAVYDAEFRWSRDDDFFLTHVNETPAARVLDLGCGTGRLALGIAAAGHTVTGVDPAHASLTAARAKAGADTVTWIEGTSADLPTDSFDVAVMTSHVAQFLVDDDQWTDTLTDIKRSLVPDGRLIFDTRDPQARGWRRWEPSTSLRQITLPDHRAVTAWTKVTAVNDYSVDISLHYRFPDDLELLSTATLRFRTEHELRSSLLNAGFTIDHIYGGWDHQPIGAEDGEFLVIARA